ncbi:MAG: bifunctional DNA-formamidopyrimidine glycosylase/DNA-(apurinic or apyrimidinic site) lyase [Thermomicrobiales bacterium]
MPELPEVEAIRTGIDAQLIGKRVVSYDLSLPKLIEAPSGMSLDQILDQPLEGVERRGKYLAIIFPDVVGVVHLKLAGQVVLRDAPAGGFQAGHPVPAFNAELPHKSTHLVLSFDDGSKLYLTDIRHFTRIRLMPRDELPAYWDSIKLGPDTRSAEFTLEVFRERMARRRQARIKPLLLDQSFVAGLGNIYVDESLYRAKIHPERKASELTDAEIEALFEAIGAILDIAVPLGGAEILNGKAVPDHGGFPFIHGREGEPCLECGTPIRKFRVNNRGTYICPECQPPISE